MPAAKCGALILRRLRCGSAVAEAERSVATSFSASGRSDLVFAGQRRRRIAFGVLPIPRQMPIGCGPRFSQRSKKRCAFLSLMRFGGRRAFQRQALEALLMIDFGNRETSDNAAKAAADLYWLAFLLT